MEDDDGQQEANDGHDAPDVCYDSEGQAVLRRQGCRVEVHEHSEVGEVFTLADYVASVVPHNPAAFVRPRTREEGTRGTVSGGGTWIDMCILALCIIYIYI